MKKILFLLCVLLAFLNIHSQTYITSSFNPIAGESYTKFKVTSVDTAKIDLTATGLDQTWDYSSFQLPSKGSSVRYQWSPSVAFASSFTNANMSSIDSTNIYYNYYTNSAGSSVLNGNGSIVLGTIVLSDPATLMNYPFTYNSTNSDKFSGIHTLSISKSTVTGTVTAVGDGYGSLLLPSGSFADVLRVKITTVASDVSLIGTLYTTTEQYYWYSPNYKNPLMEVIVSNNSGLYNDYTKSAYINSNLVAVGENELSKKNIDFNIYPNPTSDGNQVISYYLNIPSTVSISIANALGQKVFFKNYKKEQQGFYSETITFDKKEKGIYFVSLFMQGTKIEKKIIVN